MDTGAKPLIIPVFITGQGCPQQCVFCCGRVTAGPAEEVTPGLIEEKARKYGAGKGRAAQLAFYGGNFTGLPPAEQERLLDCARALAERGLVSSVRVSTRPDYITEEIAHFLQARGVAAVELGAESLLDSVLEASRRGHTAAQVAHAVRSLKSCGIETGLHLMAGLLGDTPEGFLESVEKAILLRPDTVRVHPTIVFAGTPLAGQYERGEYRPLSLGEAVGLCRAALVRFTLAGIPVIRMGLQATPEMEQHGSIVAGPYHPSFGMLVKSSVFLEMARGLLARIPLPESGAGDERSPGLEITLAFSPADESSLRGLRNCNIEALRDTARPRRLILKPDNSQRGGTLRAIAGSRAAETCIIEFYGGARVCSSQVSLQ